MFACSTKEALVELDDSKESSMHRYPSQASYVERNDANEYVEHGDENRDVALVTYELRIYKSVYRPNYMYMEIMNSNKRTSHCRSCSGVNKRFCSCRVVSWRLRC